jgi:hypothetical protein
MSYRRMALEAHFSPAHLARAADGRALPRWEVTRAYVQACGGVVDEWHVRWCAARDAVRARALADAESVPVPASTGGG